MCEVSLDENESLLPDLKKTSMFYRIEQDYACTVCKILYLYITLTFLCLSSYNLNGTIQPDILFAHII